MTGPLPNPQRRRRNKPTIPTTELDAAGRDEELIPDVPPDYDLAEPGRNWWVWAWTTPQACGWSDGDLYTVARRAALEDDMVLMREFDPSDLGLDEIMDVESAYELKRVLGRLKSLAIDELRISKEARELDDRLGLTPKGLAALRWKIVDNSPQQGESSGKRSGKPANRRGLKVV